MKVDNFANRLRTIMRIKGFKQIDLVRLTKLDKSLISCYLKGKYEAKQENLTLLAGVLGTNEAWLMGYDIPMNNESVRSQFDDIEIQLQNKIMDNVRLCTKEEKEQILQIIDVIRKSGK